MVGISAGPALAGTERSKLSAKETVVAYVEDHHGSVVTLLIGDREVVVNDRNLVTAILNAAGVREMSSHREAPEISKDPVADNTDVYAFVSPDKPDTVTLIANFIPLQQPDGGPNFYEFGDDVAYDIKIANGGKGKADIVYRFRFTTKIRNPKTFLYNTGPINDIVRQTWNRPQYYSVTRPEAGRTRLLARAWPARR